MYCFIAEICFTRTVFSSGEIGSLPRRIVITFSPPFREHWLVTPVEVRELETEREDCMKSDRKVT